VELSPQTSAPELTTIPDIADLLAVPVTRVHQMLRDGQLVAVRDDRGVRKVPAEFVQDGALVKHLTAVITLLRDLRFSDEEIVEWLFRSDESLPGTPIAALRANRSGEVKRRAQVAGY
jgi:hypothetical protein